MAIEFGHSVRGARHYDHVMPLIAKSLASIAKSLETLAEKKQDEITLNALHQALDAVGGRSIALAEMIDDLERKGDD